MTLKRCVPFLLLLLLALSACRAPSPVAAPGTSTSARQEQRALFAGALVLAPEGFQAQAVGSGVVSGAVVSLIDPATSEVKGTGLTDASGNFTVMAAPGFTPALGALYLLEASKPMGAAGTATLALRTLVSMAGSGWTSISGDAVVISPMTTAVALLQRHRTLSAAEILSKVSYDPVTRRSLPLALSAACPESLVRQVVAQVEEALALNLDPAQVVRPNPDGTFGLWFEGPSRNLLANGSFEEDVSDSWILFDSGLKIATVSPDPATATHLTQSAKLTVTGPGGAWLGQGYLWWINPKKVIPFEAGKTYTYSIYAKGATGNEKIALTVAGADSKGDAANVLRSSIVTLTPSFQRYSLAYTATESVKAQVFVTVGSDVGQAVFPEVVWLDGAQLEVGTVATPFAPEAGRLVYDSTATPASVSAGVTYAPGYRGGTGVVLDTGLNLVPNGHAASGTSGWVLPNGGAFSTTTAHGLPPNAAGSQTFLLAHNATTDPNYVSVQLSVKPFTTYTMSAWVCAPSAGNPPIFDLTYGTTVGGPFLGRDTGSTTLSADDRWRRISLSFTTGNLTSLYVYPVRMVTANTKVAFTMFQVEEGGTVHPYAGDPSSDRFAVDGRYVPRRAGSISYWFSPHFDASDTRNDWPTQMLGVSQFGDEVVLMVRKFGNSLGLGIRDGADWHWSANSAPVTSMWAAGSWHHLALTWGAPTGFALYLDGKAIATHPYQGGIYTGFGVDGTHLGNLYWQGVSRNSTYVHNAVVDRIRIHDYPRSAADIAREALGIQPPAGL